MRIIFLTLVDVKSIAERGIYQDLIRKFVSEGHDMYTVSPAERRQRGKTILFEDGGSKILKVKTLNIQKSNVLEKGVGTLLLEYQFLKAIKKYLGEVKFDLILYSTPPVTFNKVISYLKFRDGAFSYLLLKDIFPQNAVDLGMMKKGGFVYQYFRKKERELYRLSDAIGCMSPANVEYLLKHNTEITKEKVEVNPNSIDIKSSNSIQSKKAVRDTWNIPLESVVFFYGGNLGKPQGIEFLIDVLEQWKNVEQVFFFIVGNGTQHKYLAEFIENERPQNIILRSAVPKTEYDLLVSSCDVGLIFLDARFSIPNFPSRLLSYLENRLPVIAATDSSSDIGPILEAASAGFFVAAGDKQKFSAAVEVFLKNRKLISEMGENGYNLLLKEYKVDVTYNKIIDKLQNRKVVHV